MICATMGPSHGATPVLEVEGGEEAQSPVSKVATDCKAGVKFDLVGHKRRDGSEGQHPSETSLALAWGQPFVFSNAEGCSSYAKLL